MGYRLFYQDILSFIKNLISTVLSTIHWANRGTPYGEMSQAIINIDIPAFIPSEKNTNIATIKRIAYICDKSLP